MVKKQKRGGSFFKERTGVIVAVFFVFGVLVIGRLFYLQVLKHSRYNEAAEDQHQVDREILQSRGEIFMADYKNNNLAPLVINREMGLLYVVPKEVIAKEETAKNLADILESDSQKNEQLKAEILSKLGKPDDPYEPIQHKVEPDVVEKIKNLKMAGVYFSEELVRYYPEKEAAGQVTGFLGFSDKGQVGQYGIEGYFEGDLAGEKGKILADKDPSGRIIPASEKQLKEADDGQDLILTIDRVIQGKAYEFIRQGVEKSEAESGSLIVMDPKNGQVKAMANYPSFDPNNYGLVGDIKNYRNLSISETYEPGSIFKIITMAAGIDSGAVRPEDTFVDTGETKIGKNTIRNADNKKYGKITMAGILENSVNNGTVYVALKTGRENFKKYVEAFGFGELTGIELNGEAKGEISSLAKKGDIYLATASFGQGLTVTPMQMAAALATIVNGGELVKPHIVDYLRKDGQEIPRAEENNVRQVVSPKTAEIIKAMMVSVVKNGHTKSAQVAGYNIGGKTGTAEIANKDGGGYSNENNHSFIGFGPMEDTRFVIVVKISKPKVGRFAESTAVPVFKNMASFLLQYYQVEPED
ncbi:penicillin-binding protein 2 [Candidatus Kuenenbacteria bacterium]|nr:penicillin-binding protein 2 [Candidatus Kuenenbacteria bacterium]